MTSLDRTWIRGADIAAPHSAGSTAPTSLAPRGAVDCHHHIFDLRFQKPGMTEVPSATVQDYSIFKQRLGIERSVFVVSSNYEDDPSCLLDGLAQLGSEAARGVALVYPDVSDGELDRLDAAGVRGVRIYFGKGKGITAEGLKSLAARIGERSWSLCVVGARDKDVLLDWEGVLQELPCPIVLDHIAWIPQPEGRNSKSAGLARRLLANPKNYVKLSGPYLSSRVGPPDYRDVDEVALDLAEVAPKQILWGSDWPHPIAQLNGHLPDGAALFDQLSRWIPDPARRQLALVDNPHRLYWSR